MLNESLRDGPVVGGPDEYLRWVAGTVGTPPFAVYMRGLSKMKHRYRVYTHSNGGTSSATSRRKGTSDTQVCTTLSAQGINRFETLTYSSHQDQPKGQRED